MTSLSPKLDSTKSSRPLSAAWQKCRSGTPRTDTQNIAATDRSPRPIDVRLGAPAPWNQGAPERAARLSITTRPECRLWRSHRSRSEVNRGVRRAVPRGRRLGYGRAILNANNAKPRRLCSLSLYSLESVAVSQPPRAVRQTELVGSHLLHLAGERVPRDAVVLDEPGDLHAPGEQGGHDLS